MAEKFCEVSNEDLMQQYHVTKSLAMKQELTVRYAYIVQILARQLRTVYMSFSDMDDVVNEGILVLMQAIDHFDASKNAKFETYASLRVRGAIIDFARKQDWVPRSVRKSIKEVEQATSILYEKNNRYPTDEEICAFLNISLEKYNKILVDGNFCNMLSLNAVMEDSFNECQLNPVGRTDFEYGAQAKIEKQEMTQLLKQAISALKPQEQQVIALYYSKQMTIKDIGKVLGLTESRISQIHSKSILKLRHSLQVCQR